MMNENDQKIIALYLKTRQQQPSAQLDNKILKAAEEKCVPHQHKSKKIVWALSSVAIIVLSVNVVLKLIVEPTATYAPTIAQQKSLSEMDILSNNGLAQESTIEIHKKRAVQKYQASERKKYIAKPKLSSLPMARTMPSLKLEMIEPSLPIFPFNAHKLTHLYPALLIKQQHKNTIQVFNSKTLILSLNALNNSSIKVTAYPQENELKLGIDWGLKSSCKQAVQNNQCLLNQKQMGSFSKNHLISVTWLQ